MKREIGKSAIEFFALNGSFDAVVIETWGLQEGSELGLGRTLENKRVQAYYENIDEKVESSVRKHGNKAMPLIKTPARYTECHRFWLSMPTRHYAEGDFDIELLEESCKRLARMAENLNLHKIILPKPTVDWKYYVDVVKPMMCEHLNNNFIVVEPEMFMSAYLNMD